MLLSLPFRSTGADTILSYAAERPDEYLERRRVGDKAVRLIVDHAVPVAVIIDQLFGLDADLSREGVRRSLKRFYFLGLLSNAEDVTLNQIGLRSRMPGHWDGNELIARYREAAILKAVEPNAA